MQNRLLKRLSHTITMLLLLHINLMGLHCKRREADSTTVAASTTVSKHIIPQEKQSLIPKNPGNLVSDHSENISDYATITADASMEKIDKDEFEETNENETDLEETDENDADLEEADENESDLEEANEDENEVSLKEKKKKCKKEVIELEEKINALPPPLTPLYDSYNANLHPYNPMYVSKDKEDNHFTHNSTQNATDYHVTRNGLKKGLKKLWTNKIKKLKTITYRLLTLQYKEATLFCLEQKLEKLENKKETLTQKRATIDTVTELTKLKKCKKKKLDLKIRMKEFKIKLITKQIQKKQVNSEKCTNNLPYSQFSPTTPQTNSEKCTNNNLLYPQLLPTAPYDSPPYDHPPPYSLYTTPPYP